MANPTISCPVSGQTTLTPSLISVDIAIVANWTQYLEYWGLSLLTLGSAVVLLDRFYRLFNSDLELYNFKKEALVAGIASAVQGAGFWFSASLFHGDPFKRLVIPGALAGLIYWIAHLERWSGYEICGIAFFQTAIISTGICVMAGNFKLAALVLVLFTVGLAIVAGIARNL